MLRTHTCGELSSSHAGQSVTLSGWVGARRDLGGLIFIDLRDRYGVTQLVFDPEAHKDAHSAAEKVRPEWVIQVTGEVKERKSGQENKDLATGSIEISVEKVEVLGQAQTPPFEVDAATDIREDLRLEYRYLDLRNARMQKNLKLRNDMVHVIRNYFHGQDFIDVETPIMVKGTPEGSREYLVPSRLHAGKFYVLPQSPQQLKQLLMVGGVDKYFQIARCFRDEDLRGDRQPEFTQFELEMSFVEQDDVLEVIEGCFIDLTEKCAPQKNYTSFLENGKFIRLTWQEAMEQYGSDKPDLRFGMPFSDISEEAKDCGFGIFESSEHVFALAVRGEECNPSGTVADMISRKVIDGLTELAQTHGAKGLAWYKVGQDGGAVAKNATPAFLETLKTKTGAQDGDVIFFGAGTFLDAVEPLGQVRLALGDQFELRDPNDFAYCWVTDFPMFEEKEDGTLQAAHHPFTMPNKDDLDLLDTEPLRVRAYAYDIVMNGVELGGGSIRIHDSALQKKMFEVLGLTDEDIEHRFGHMIRAFSYGAPPHGGAAMGLDRTVMLFADEPNIREVIAFPKNQSAQDLMLGAPSAMPEEELREQNIKVVG